MPFPSDEKVLETAKDIVLQLQALFGKHPGFRPAHAKGIILSGKFTPTSTASSLSIAQHFNNPTSVWARFSNSTGLPEIPDNDSNAAPRGIGLRFNLGDRKHTDIIAHSTPFFPAQTGEQFLGLFQAIAATGSFTGEGPSPVEQFLGKYPKALAFVQAPKPAPVSYGTDEYWAVNAFKLIAADGKATFVKYHIVPVGGRESLDAAELEKKDPDYLSKELVERLEAGKIGFKLLAQVAKEGDVTDDATVHWPETNEVVELGSFELDAVVPDHLKESKYIIFDPIPRLQGVEPSDDPLLEMRAAVYLLSGKERRAA